MATTILPDDDSREPLSSGYVAPVTQAPAPAPTSEPQTTGYQVGGTIITETTEMINRNNPSIPPGYGDDTLVVINGLLTKTNGGGGGGPVSEPDTTKQDQTVLMAIAAVLVLLIIKG